MKRRSTPVILPFLLALSACGGDPGPARANAGQAQAGGDAGLAGEGGSVEAGPTALTFTSTTFDDGGVIPIAHRCANSLSPAFAWGGGPRETQSYALVMRDSTLGGFLHWILYDIPASTRELAEGVPPGYEPGTPPGMKQATVLGQAYFGPCGPTNTYEFTLHAVDVAALTGIDATSAGPDVIAAIEPHSLATAKLTVRAGP